MPIGAVPLALRCAAGATMHATGRSPPNRRTMAGLLVRLVPRARHRGAAFAIAKARRQPGAWG
jgi:hypothetical protein